MNAKLPKIYMHLYYNTTLCTTSGWQMEYHSSFEKYIFAGIEIISKKNILHVT